MSLRFIGVELAILLMVATVALQGVPLNTSKGKLRIRFHQDRFQSPAITNWAGWKLCAAWPLVFETQLKLSYACLQFRNLGRCLSNITPRFNFFQRSKHILNNTHYRNPFGKAVKK